LVELVGSLIEHPSRVRVAATAKGHPGHDEAVDHDILTLISGEPGQEEEREN
jgi:hypothetical protein